MERPRKLRILELAGSPREIGLKHGRSLAAEIRQIRRAFLAYLARVSLYAGALPFYGLMLGLAQCFKPYIPLRLKQEMAGVATGADVALGTVLLLNVIDDLFNSGPRCSALAVGEDYTAAGPYLLGRNLDYPLFTEILVNLQTLFMLEPFRGQPLASLAWPGYVGVCTGMNKSGVALAQLSAMSRERSLRGVPAALRFRQALQEGETVAAVAAGVLKTRTTIGNSLMLCGPQEAVVLELSARCRAMRRPAGGLLTATNHYQSRKMLALKGPFPLPPPFTCLAPYHFTEDYSRARNARLQELAARKPIEPLALQGILADPQIANPGTVGSAIFSPARLTMWVAQGRRAPVNRGPFVQKQLW